MFVRGYTNLLLEGKSENKSNICLQSNTASKSRFLLIHPRGISIFWLRTHYICMLCMKMLKKICSTHTRRPTNQNPAKIPKIRKVQIMARFWTTGLYTPLYKQVCMPPYTDLWSGGKFENFWESPKTHKTHQKVDFQQFWEFLTPEKWNFGVIFFPKKLIPGATERPYNEISPGFRIWKKLKNFRFSI